MTVKADCQSDFDEIEEYFQVGYKYNKDTDDFSIVIINPNRFRYAISFNTDDIDTEIEKNVVGVTMTNLINNYKKDEYYYGIVAIYDGCKNVKLKEETIQLKKYNPYADDPLCEENEEFVLCQKDYEKTITKEEFESRINTYIKGKDTNSSTNNSTNNNNTINNSKQNENSNNKNILDKIINFIEENIITTIIIALFVIILIISVILTIKYETKRRRLE